MGQRYKGVQVSGSEVQGSGVSAKAQWQQLMKESRLNTEVRPGSARLQPADRESRAAEGAGWGQARRSEWSGHLFNIQMYIRVSHLSSTFPNILVLGKPPQVFPAPLPH